MTEPASAPPEPVGRAVCYRCHKPQLTCICGQLARICNRTPVWIIQHPRERFHPIGTARILALGLSQVEVSVCYRAGAEPPAGLPAGAALLYPAKRGEGLPVLRKEPPKAAPTALVVIDGTWANAHTLYRDNPWLHQLPRYGIEPAEPSRYRIRREPAAHCVSTLEAVVAALRLLEPDSAGLGGLLAAFDSMIDMQIEIARQRGGGRRRSPAQSASCRLPRAFRKEPERLVVVYGESRVDSPHGMAARGHASRQLLQWCALRPASGAIFDETVQPALAAPAGNGPGSTERLLAYTGLDPADMAASVSFSELRQRWRAYCRSEDIFVSWNQYGLDLLRLVSAGDGSGLLLKAAYGDLRRGRSGSLEQLVAREGCQPLNLALRGRAKLQLGRAAALLLWLQSIAATK